MKAEFVYWVDRVDTTEGTAMHLVELSIQYMLQGGPRKTSDPVWISELFDTDVARPSPIVQSHLASKFLSVP